MIISVMWLAAVFDCQVLRALLESQVTEEQLESVADRAIQEADMDQDQAISFEEFRKVPEGDPHSASDTEH